MVTHAISKLRSRRALAYAASLLIMMVLTLGPSVHIARERGASAVGAAKARTVVDMVYGEDAAAYLAGAPEAIVIFVMAVVALLPLVLVGIGFGASRPNSVPALVALDILMGPIAVNCGVHLVGFAVFAGTNLTTQVIIPWMTRTLVASSLSMLPAAAVVLAVRTATSRRFFGACLALTLLAALGTLGRCARLAGWSWLPTPSKADALLFSAGWSSILAGGAIGIGYWVVVGLFLHLLLRPKVKAKDGGHACGSDAPVSETA